MVGFVCLFMGLSQEPYKSVRLLITAPLLGGQLGVRCVVLCRGLVVAVPGLLVVFVGLVCVLCVFLVGAHVALARWSRASRVVEFGEQLGSCCASCALGDPSPMAEFSECGCGCTESCTPCDCECGRWGCCAACRLGDEHCGECGCWWCAPAGVLREPNESDRHDDRLWS